MTAYSYDKCLQNAHKVNWRIDEVLDGRAFDLDKRWLPSALSAADDISFLDASDRRKLNQVEMAAYAHVFGYVEGFVTPLIVGLSSDCEGEPGGAFEALTNFAAEEVKHMHLFRKIRDQVNQILAVDMKLIDGENETADFVLSKNKGAVLLLTACIEWMTQRHHLECFKDDENLDSFTKHIFKSHWQEEAQHAQLDHLETLRAFSVMTDEDRDQAITDLIELVGAVDGLLQQQARFDTQNFQACVDRTFTKDEGDELYEHILRAKRHTFLGTGVTHPRFQELFTEVATPEQQERVGAALLTLLPHLAHA